MGLSCEYSDPPRKRGPPKGCIEVIENRAHRIESLLGKDPLAWQPSQRMSNAIPRCMMDKAAVPLDAAPASRIIVNASVTNDGVRDNRLLPSRNPLLEIVASTMPALVESFFVHFNLFFPILSRQHYLYQLQHQPSNLNPLLRNAVLALGSRYTGSDIYANLYFERCQRILNATSSPDNVTLSTVQALAVMCWYCYLLGDMHDCRSLRHRLVSMIHDLALYRDPDTSFGIVEMELRRRAFWVVFVMDQWLACCLGESLLSRRSWNCRWPRLEDSQLQAIDRKHLDMSAVPVDYALQVTVFTEMIKLSHIVSDHLGGFSNAPSALTNWLFNLPCYLEFNRPAGDGPPAPITRIYHMLYYTAQIMLHRTSDTYGVCTSAANTIVHIAEQMIHDDQTKDLHNISLISLTLSTAVLLDRNDNRSSLHKSIYAFKNAHLVLLKHLPLDAILVEFIEKHQVSMTDDTFYQQEQRPSLKRPREEEDGEESQEIQDHQQQQQQQLVLQLQQQEQQSDSVVDGIFTWADVLPAEKFWWTTCDMIGNVSKKQQSGSFVSSSSSWSLSSPGSSTHSPAMSCVQPITDNKDQPLMPFDLLNDNDIYIWMPPQQPDIFIPADFDLPV
ncbi:fungal-specific transcription factor domain-containing protein [Dichotomocladium elegans]|nr:fungal-specific transcription factor domain-containing protein [Dichotomocladium elegans]